MADYCRQEFRKETGYGLKVHPLAIKKLSDECEKAKKQFGDKKVEQFEIKVNSFSRSMPLRTIITREKYNELCKLKTDLK